MGQPCTVHGKASVDDGTMGTWEEFLLVGPEESAKMIIREIRDKYPGYQNWAQGVLERARGEAGYDPKKVLAFFLQGR